MSSAVFLGTKLALLGNDTAPNRQTVILCSARCFVSLSFGNHSPNPNPYPLFCYAICLVVLCLNVSHYCYQYLMKPCEDSGQDIGQVRVLGS